MSHVLVLLSQINEEDVLTYSESGTKIQAVDRALLSNQGIEKQST